MTKGNSSKGTSQGRHCRSNKCDKPSDKPVLTLVQVGRLTTEQESFVLGEGEAQSA